MSGLLVEVTTKVFINLLSRFSTVLLLDYFVATIFTLSASVVREVIASFQVLHHAFTVSVFLNMAM
ncbi:hypothetical protein NB466_19235 [Vibrio fluvialis]|uniref:hypothetical protein n=1 Tax=Vibrio fluvialis TaxID=676 RepID=UPI00215D0275|nr:hypothetical protein [Vibrio fluvialis]MCR9300985.1 hypothetical protein [Vibrio fluvialis]